MDLIIYYFQFIVKIYFNRCLSLSLSQLLSILSFIRIEIRLWLLECCIQHSSLIYWLYRSSTLSCIQCHIHKGSCLSTHLHLMVLLSIKTYLAHILTFQMFSYTLKHYRTSFFWHLRPVLIIFHVFDFIVLFHLVQNISSGLDFHHIFLGF